MLKVKNIKGKVTPAKKTISISDVVIDKLKLVDETGDVTGQVLEKIPSEYKTIDVKITFELPCDEEGNE